MNIIYPIIVEGKYDKIKLDSIVSANVITTDGFGIFNNKEKLALIRRLALNSKIILLTDSDGGGHLIRSHIKTAIPSESLINLYIPRIEGKEKRKSAPSKEGTLGVEGIDKERLLNLLAPFSSDATPTKRTQITKADFYAWGLSGKDNSSQLRALLLKHLDLPSDMSPNAALQAINMLYTKEDIEKAISEL